MQFVNKNLLIAMALTMGSAGIANADVWNGAGDGISFEDALNWDPSTNAFAGSTREIDGAFTVTRDTDVTVSRTFVDGGATLNITGGTHSDNQSGNTTRNFIGNTGAGTVNQSGGNYNIGHILAVGRHGTGIYNLSGGTLDISRGGNTLTGNPNTFGGNAGGSLSIGWGNGTGLMNITGGSLVTRIGVEVGDRGTFQVQGNDATIGIGSSGTLDGHWWQDAGGVLSMGIGAAGVSTILIDDTDQATADPYAYFADGSVLDLSFYGTEATEGTWTLMELENGDIDDQGLELAVGVDSSEGDGIGWSFNVDNSGANGLLTATYVIPEPATLGLVAVFGGAVLFLRRRFMI
ncbi:PEP-CTERM sorting domain-containing protein [Pontiellaceae bacterium B12219]|nr:PEP-CTERM sorting domain-containing protein [Pontiellaceae bacterium B12219]